MIRLIYLTNILIDTVSALYTVDIATTVFQDYKKPATADLLKYEIVKLDHLGK